MVVADVYHCGLDYQVAPTNCACVLRYPCGLNDGITIELIKYKISFGNVMKK
jgi:hypothetical protein